MATDTSTSPKIKSVHCPDPPREDEYGWSAIVGQNFNDARLGKISKIERREENLGTYGIVWYDIFCSPPDEAGFTDTEVLVASFNASQVTIMTYFIEGKDY